jgi:hypothetical protein
MATTIVMSRTAAMVIFRAAAMVIPMTAITTAWCSGYGGKSYEKRDERQRDLHDAN